MQYVMAVFLSIFDKYNQLRSGNNFLTGYFNFATGIHVTFSHKDKLTSVSTMILLSSVHRL